MGSGFAPSGACDHRNALRTSSVAQERVAQSSRGLSHQDADEVRQSVSRVPSKPRASGDREPLLRNLQVGRINRFRFLRMNLGTDDPVEADRPRIEGSLSCVRSCLDEHSLRMEVQALVPFALSDVNVLVSDEATVKTRPSDHLTRIENEDVVPQRAKGHPGHDVEIENR